MASRSNLLPPLLSIHYPAQSNSLLASKRYLRLTVTRPKTPLYPKLHSIRNLF